MLYVCDGICVVYAIVCIYHVVYVVCVCVVCVMLYSGVVCGWWCIYSVVHVMLYVCCAVRM